MARDKTKKLSRVAESESRTLRFEEQNIKKTKAHLAASSVDVSGKGALPMVRVTWHYSPKNSPARVTLSHLMGKKKCSGLLAR